MSPEPEEVLLGVVPPPEEEGESPFLSAQEATRLALTRVKDRLKELRDERDHINAEVIERRNEINAEVKGLVADERVLTRALKLYDEPAPPA